MKKFILSIAALSMIVAVGCNKKDDDKSGRQQMIVGTWNLSQFGNDANGNGALDGAEAMAASDTTMGSQLIINSNGQATQSVTLGGVPFGSVTGNWSLINNENWLRLVDGTDTMAFEIKSLSNNSLTFRDTTGAAMGAEYTVWSK